MRNRIAQLCDEHNVNINSLGNNAGLNPSTIRSFTKNYCKSPRADTVYYICLGLGITLKEFYDSELFENLDDD